MEMQRALNAKGTKESEAVSIAMRNFTEALPGECKLGVLSTQPKVRKDFPRVKKFSISLKAKASRIYRVFSHGAMFCFGYKFSNRILQHEVNFYLKKFHVSEYM